MTELDITQKYLIEILERSCHLEKREDYDSFLAAMTALDYSPVEKRSKEVFTRMLRCIYDTESMPLIVYNYAMSLEKDPVKGVILYICETIKAAPEMIPLSPGYFAMEVFQGAINYLYTDSHFDNLNFSVSDIIIPVAQTFSSLPPEQKEFLLNHIWKLAEKWAKYDNIRPEETQYGIIYKRIVDAIQALT
ncbi:MAG: hypothetical protein LBT09_15230 [Planctomycetaceae bacterium]|jgi:hypothetical protein|nr:hypothetical protein [Planctomycetaceae bacterium]